MGLLLTLRHHFDSVELRITTTVIVYVCSRLESTFYILECVFPVCVVDDLFGNVLKV